MEEQVILASSATEAGISCFDLHSGAEHLRYRSCTSPPHGLISVGGRHLASSQLRSSASCGSILYWSWNKPQAEVKSFPAEPINPLISNREGTYIVGGGISGDIYLWQVATGRLLKKWHAHHRAVTCLVYSDDESLLISGAEDGIFDDVRIKEANNLFEYSFSGHSLRVTDIVTGYGGCNAIVVSASEDRTCKVWSLSKGKLLREITFQSIIDAVALDPGEHVFYAGGRDGKIYIAALNAQPPSICSYGLHIIGTLSDHSKAVTCLAFSAEGHLLVSGAEDGIIRVWDTKSCNIVRILKHAKGPVNNILVIRRPLGLYPRVSMNSQALPMRKPLLPPPLEKYPNSKDENSDVKAVITTNANPDRPFDASYVCVYTMDSQITELQEQGSTVAAEMEIERLKHDCRRSMQMVQQWKKMYENLNQFCVDELLDGDQGRGPNSSST